RRARGDRRLCGGERRTVGRRIADRPRMSEWIGGRRPVAEALAAGRPAHRLLISANAKPNAELNALLAGARQAGVSAGTVSPDRLSRIAGFDGDQGVLLEVGER